MEDAWKLKGDKYSPNLKKWCQKNRTHPRHEVYLDQKGTPWIGWVDDGRWFIGSRLWNVLGSGGRAMAGCWDFPVSSLKKQESFWDEYARHGRCAIDKEHRTYFIGDESRWQENGETRSCKWCGGHSQKLVRWTESVERSRWLSESSALEQEARQ